MRTKRQFLKLAKNRSYLQRVPALLKSACLAAVTISADELDTKKNTKQQRSKTATKIIILVISFSNFETHSLGLPYHPCRVTSHLVCHLGPRGQVDCPCQDFLFVDIYLGGRGPSYLFRLLLLVDLRFRHRLHLRRFLRYRFLHHHRLRRFRQIRGICHCNRRRDHHDRHCHLDLLFHRPRVFRRLHRLLSQELVPGWRRTNLLAQHSTLDRYFLHPTQPTASRALEIL